MNPLLQQWQRRLSAQHGEADARLEDFGWMLQELRVSLFAQETEDAGDCLGEAGWKKCWPD